MAIEPNNEQLKKIEEMDLDDLFDIDDAQMKNTDDTDKAETENGSSVESVSLPKPAPSASSVESSMPTAQAFETQGGATAVSATELPKRPEIIEKAAELPVKQMEEVAPVVATTQATQFVSPVEAKDPVLVEIENIMTEGLEQEFLKMTPQMQQKFQQEGEEAAGLIRALLLKTKVKVKKIISIMVKWLKLIPGVNKYFLIQEAKIKADKIVKLKE